VRFQAFFTYALHHPLAATFHGRRCHHDTVHFHFRWRLRQSRGVI
jgi:hypothetical protein